MFNFLVSIFSFSKTKNCSFSNFVISFPQFSKQTGHNFLLAVLVKIPSERVIKSKEFKGS